MDISLPMSEYEKSLNNELSLIGSKMNAINKKKKKKINAYPLRKKSN